MSMNEHLEERFNLRSSRKKQGVFALGKTMRKNSIISKTPTISVFNENVSFARVSLNKSKNWELVQNPEANNVLILESFTHARAQKQPSSMRLFNEYVSKKDKMELLDNDFCNVAEDNKRLGRSATKRINKRPEFTVHDQAFDDALAQERTLYLVERIAPSNKLVQLEKSKKQVTSKNPNAKRRRALRAEASM